MSNLIQRLAKSQGAKCLYASYAGKDNDAGNSIFIIRNYFEIRDSSFDILKSPVASYAGIENAPGNSIFIIRNYFEIRYSSFEIS